MRFKTKHSAISFSRQMGKKFYQAHRAVKTFYWMRPINGGAYIPKPCWTLVLKECGARHRGNQ